MGTSSHEAMKLRKAGLHKKRVMTNKQTKGCMAFLAKNRAGLPWPWSLGIRDEILWRIFSFFLKPMFPGLPHSTRGQTWLWGKVCDGCLGGMHSSGVGRPVSPQEGFVWGLFSIVVGCSETEPHVQYLPAAGRTLHFVAPDKES